MKIAIQGEPGSFSEQAALRLVPGARIVPCPTFREVFDALAQRRVERALIPIENTLAGSVTENYDLLLEYSAHIIAEALLRIEHCLIVPRGVRRQQIRRVLSHPVALQQCRHFLRAHRQWEVVPFYDTAGSVKHLVENGIQDAAAIASRRAVEVYGARLLEPGIEDNKENYTRFFLLSRQARRAANASKVSLSFATRNEPGALFKCLSVFALRNLDLTRIESRPVPGQPWEYSFYLDLLGDPRQPALRNALRHLEEVTDSMKVLGAYPAARRPQPPAGSPPAAKKRR